QTAQLNTRVAWEQWCDELIASLEEQSRAKRPQLSIKRQLVTACTARFESLKDSVGERFVHVGAGYRLRWREIETAFVVLERMRNTIERHGIVKANTQRSMASL
ncbi:hypothetical protein ALC56_00050, partial [Trachymyrmex septentrionalis]